jgi:hypothetical protein
MRTPLAQAALQSLLDTLREALVEAPHTGDWTVWDGSREHELNLEDDGSGLVLVATDTAMNDTRRFRVQLTLEETNP